MEKNKSLTLGQKSIIASNFFNISFQVFIETFMVVMIMNSLENPMAWIAVYSFMLYCFIQIGLAAASRFIKHGGNSRMNAYRVGQALIVAFLVITATGGVEDNFYVLSAIGGVALALIYCPLEATIAENVPAGAMTKFSNYDAAAMNTMRILAPVALGVIISRYSFGVAALSLVPFFAASFVLSFFIEKGTAQPGANLRLREFLSIAKQSRHIRNIFVLDVLSGITIWGAALVMLPMYAALLFETVSIGIIVAALTVLVILTQLAVARFGGARHMAALVKWSSVAFFVAAAAFLWFKSQASFVVYSAAYVVMSRLLGTNYKTFFYSALKVAGIDTKYTPEYHLVRHGALTVGRAVSCLLLFVAATLGTEGGMRAALTAIIALMAVLSVMVAKMNREHGDKV